MKKYLCIGGHIRSDNDGDIHYISPKKLPILYQVNPQECYFARGSEDPILKFLNCEELIILRPRYGRAQASGLKMTSIFLPHKVVNIVIVAEEFGITGNTLSVVYADIGHWRIR